MRAFYLAESQAGDVVEDVFVLTNAQFAASANGKHYIKAFVSDRSAQLTARLWNASREMFSALPENAFVRIRGRVENYQNNLQLIIESFQPAKPGTFDIADLLPTTTKDIDAMCQRVFEVMATIKHPGVSAVVHAFLDDEELMNDFARAPAASSFHHAYIGGLLEHTLNLLEITDRLLPLYPGLSRDLCLAGVFLHDIAKTWELSYNAAFAYTDSGQLIGHIVKVAMMIDRRGGALLASNAPGVTRELLDILQHIVLSHHEKLEFGSPKQPATPEAVFVALVDNLDAKTSMALAAARTNVSPSPENAVWTEFLKPFGLRMYRPDPTAPAPAPTPASTPPPATPPSAAPTTPRPPSPKPPEPTPTPTPARAPAPTSDKSGKPLISNPLFEALPPRKK